MLTNDELISLIARCALRDQAALKELHTQVSPYLNRVAYNIVKSEEYSNDVLQDSFIQIWENASVYQPSKSKPLTWMTSITRYRALDKLEREGRYSNQLAAETDIDDLQSHSSTVEQSMMQQQDKRTLNDCLETLNERGKQCIQLAYLQGYSREDLAQTFNTNTNTIKSWLHRGMKRLKACLEKKQ